MCLIIEAIYIYSCGVWAKYSLWGGHVKSLQFTQLHRNIVQVVNPRVHLATPHRGLSCLGDEQKGHFDHHQSLPGDGHKQNKGPHSILE